MFPGAPPSAPGPVHVRRNATPWLIRAPAGGSAPLNNLIIMTKKLSSFLRLPKGVFSLAFERSWVKLYCFTLGLLGLPVCEESVRTFFHRIDEIQRGRGKKGLYLYLKEAQRVLLKVLFSEDASPKGISLKGTLPWIIPGSLRRQILGGDLSAVRVVLTLLGFARTIFFKGTPNFRTITDAAPVPSGSKQNRWSKEIKRALKALNVPAWQKPSESDCKITSNRSGPNGHATLAAHWDALALVESQLWVPFQRLTALWGIPGISRRIIRISDISFRLRKAAPWILALMPARRLSLGRIGVKAEAGGKERLFAISDYWTQSLCKPLHDYLMKVLRQLPTDGTWSQEGCANRVAAATAQGKKLHCFDLSAATDRFPVWFTRLVLSLILGVEEAALWVEILTGRGYDHKGVSYRYATGQPMGTLSSWAAFALSHHVVVLIAAARCGLGPGFRDYAILGDDIVIFDDDVAEEYRDIMTSLHVEINDSKSFIATGGAEFAKRHFLRGREITGLSGSLILLAGTRLSGLRVLVTTALRRGFEITGESVLYSILLWAPSMEFHRGWRYLLVSVLGPMAPLARASALWGGLLDAPSETLLGSQEDPEGFSRLPPLQCSEGSDVVGPLMGGWRELGEEILRLCEYRRIRRTQESHTRWVDSLEGNIDSLLRGWVLMAPSRKASGRSYPSSLQALTGFGRALIEVGHPAGSESFHSEPLDTEAADWALLHPTVPLSRKATQLVPAVWGLAPSGDLSILHKASEETKWGLEVCRQMQTAIARIVPYPDVPGVLDYVRTEMFLWDFADMDWSKGAQGDPGNAATDPQLFGLLSRL